MIFEKSKFPRVNAKMDRLKGPRFIPKGHIKLRAALAQIGSAKVPGWSGEEIVEKSWHDEEGNETQALVRWREAVDLFRQELFAGGVVASYLNNDGVIVKIAGSQFAQNDIEHIFREHQEQGTLYFVEAKDLNPQSTVVSSQKFKYPFDSKIYDLTKEALAFDSTLRFETTVRETAKSQNRWPNQVEEQEKFVGRLKKRFAQEKRK